MIRNYIKGIIISNGLIWMYYASRFKNYRNSYLFQCNILATYFGIHVAAKGVQPLFTAHLFNKYVPNNVLLDETDYGKTT